jgi:SAM-dependent methyltransferase
MSFNDFQTKKLEKLIHEFKTTNKPMELEVRFSPPNEETFKRIFTKFMKEHPKSTASIEQSISIMTDSDKSGFDRKEMYFQNGVQQKIDHNRKNRHDMLKIFVNSQEVYRIALASETPSPEFGMHLAHRIRLKLRCSIIVDVWRYDFTTVIQLEKSQLSQLKAYKQKIFPNKKSTPDDFLNSIPDVPNMRYEFEIEYVGKPNDVTVDTISTAVKHFTEYVSPGFEETSSYQMIIYDLAKHLIDGNLLESFKTRNGLKRLANQPRNLTKSIFFDKVLPNIGNYYVSDKADGERCFVVIRNKQVLIVLTDKVIDMTDVFKTTDDKFSILDAEIVNMDRDDPLNSKHIKLYLFDILYKNGSKVVHEMFEKREKYLDAFVKVLKNTEKKILKRLDAKSYGQTIREMFNRKTRAYPIDGLVFTPATSKTDKYSKPNYFSMNVYKWKEAEKLSADFLILKPVPTLLGTKPYIPKKDHELYFLYSGMNIPDSKIRNLPSIRGYKEMLEGIPEPGNYFPAQFSHSAYPFSYLYYHPDSSDDLTQRIGEFIWNVEKEEWALDRLRPDKDILVKQGTAFGNNFKVAEVVFNNYLNPLTLQMMTDVDKVKYESGQNYFLTEKKETYKPLTKFNNFVKAQLIKQLENKTWIVDLAAGRGSDLFTYNGFGVQNGLFVDIDQSALEELSNRAWNMGNTRSYVFSRAPKTNIKIYTMQMDLQTSAATVLDTITHRGIPAPIGQVDGVVMNLALHYVITDDKYLTNIVKLVSKLLKPGGTFIFTTFDGQRIFKLLEKMQKGQSWDLLDTDKTLKYSLRKNYKDTKFKTGLTVGVVHPFSRGEYYDEPLVDIDNIVKSFEDDGFKLMQKGSFADWHEKFKNFDNHWFNQLSSDDKKYGTMYTYVSLRKGVKK